MRIGCLQFAPQVGDVDNNLNRADAVLSKANPKDLDLLVLPELAFSGYNFRSLQHITPYLEPTAAGITSLWARTTALKYDCVVTVGYPEKVDVAPKWPSSPEYYNSAITVNAEGETIANYRKSFLYYTDETWALEGPDGFFDGVIPGLGNVTMGICKWPTKSFERMDLNPYKFEAPWSAWEFSYHCLHKEANLVIVSMAWLTREDARSYSRSPKEPDMETLSYWLGRIEPLIRAETEGEIICVFANRTGSEEEAVYAGTSAVLGIHMGEVKVYGILGRGERALLVVDTNKPPQAKLISEPNSTASDAPPPELEPSAGMPVPDSRTNSSTSNRSALSVDTKATSRATPDSWDNIFSPMSLNEAVTPLSPPDFATPEEFYAKARKADGEYLREDLISSLSQKSAPSVHAFTPIKPTFDSIPAHIKHKSDNSQQQFSPIESPVDRPFSRVASPIDLSTPLFHRPPPSLGSMMGLSSSRQPSPPERASSRSSHRSHQTSSAEPSPPLPRSSSRSSHKSDHVSSAEPSPPLPRSSSRTSQRSHQVSSAEPSPPLVGPTSSVPQMTDIASVEQSKPCSRSSSRNDLKSTTTLTGQALPIHTRSSSRSRQRIVQSPSTDALPPLDTTMHRTSHKSGHSVSSDALSPLRRSASRTSQKSAHPVPVPAEPSPPLDRSASRASQKSVQIGTGEFSPIDRSASRVSQKSIYFVDGEPTSPLRKQTSRSNLKSCLVKYQSVNSFEPVSPKAMSPTSPMSNYKASTRQQFTPALPDSPTFNRPASPKSRNASRTRKLEQHSPDLFSQPLPRETQHAIDSLGMRTPLLPQTAINPPPGFQAAFTNNFFGPRTLHVLPRPRSTYW